MFVCLKPLQHQDTFSILSIHCLTTGSFPLWLSSFMFMSSAQKAVSDECVSHFLSASTKLCSNKAFAKADCCLEEYNSRSQPWRNNTTGFITTFIFVTSILLPFASCFLFLLFYKWYHDVNPFPLEPLFF